MSGHVPYADIPPLVRSVLDEVYTPEGVEIYWNAPNAMLNHVRPRDVDPLRVLAIANMIADGNF